MNPDWRHWSGALLLALSFEAVLGGLLSLLLSTGPRLPNPAPKAEPAGLMLRLSAPATATGSPRKPAAEATPAAGTKPAPASNRHRSSEPAAASKTARSPKPASNRSTAPTTASIETTSPEAATRPRAKSTSADSPADYAARPAPASAAAKTEAPDAKPVARETAASLPVRADSHAVAGPSAQTPQQHAPRAAQTSAGAAQTDPKVRQAYQSALLERLLRFKRYPEPARRRGLTGTVMLQIELDSSGHVVSRRVSASSGYGLLDRAALAMLDAATPLPAIPPAYGPGPYRFTIPLLYDLQ